LNNWTVPFRLAVTIVICTMHRQMAVGSHIRTILAANIITIPIVARCVIRW
jgi:hypothetical protein